MKRGMMVVSLGLVGALGIGCGAGPESDVTRGSEAAQIEGAPDLTPAYWNVDALADSPSPGSEPINVIITTNLKMDDIVSSLPRTQNPEQGLLTWGPVPIGVGLAGCISEERAVIDGPSTTAGKKAQTVSLRLGGVFGCGLERRNLIF